MPVCFTQYTNIGKVEIFHVRGSEALKIDNKVHCACAANNIHKETFRAWNKKPPAKVKPDIQNFD